MAHRPRSQNPRSGQTERRGRVLALQFLYTHDVRGQEDNDIGEILDWLCAEESTPASARRKAQTVVAGILDDIVRIDDVIQRYAPALPVNLLAAVDRNILRVAIYELTAREGAPSRVIINEATDLASTFGSESSARFVNGVLGSVLDSLPNAVEPVLTQPSQC